METLVAVEPGDWAEASADQATFFKSLGSRVPREMFDEQKRLAEALNRKSVSQPRGAEART
jgi:hypothetical protein